MACGATATVCEEVYRQYGLMHFKEKYLLDDEDLQLICVRKSHTTDQIAGWADTSYGRVPLFEKLNCGRLISERKDGRVNVCFDAYVAIGKMLAGSLENLSSEDRRKVAMIPVMDIYEQILFDAVSCASAKKGKPISKPPFWPAGSKFALCLTHDIDEVRKTYQYFTRPVLHLRKGRVKRALRHIASFFCDKLSGTNPYWTFESMMELEKEMDVRSTSYFLQEDGKFRISRPESWAFYARRYRFNQPEVSAVMREMTAGGWEVGLHGSYYSYLSGEKIIQEKRDLEAALGTAVSGIRQHHLNLSIPDTWERQKQAGFEYDTSLGFKKDIGFRWGTCFPFKPLNYKTGKQIDVLQLPLLIMDATLFYNGEDNWKKISMIIDSVERCGGLLVVLFHHPVYNEREYPGWQETYRRIITTCREKGAWIATGSQINSWWRGRR